MDDTATAPPQLVPDHPAKWSARVLDVLTELVEAEAERLDQRVRVLDPFAGVGRQRLADALGSAAVISVTGVELQPEWSGTMVSRLDPIDTDTVNGDATDLPAEWSGRFDVIATSPCYGNRMADHHDAADRCKACDGTGLDGPPDAEYPPAAVAGQRSGPGPCPTCKGQGLSWRNTYAHALRRQGGDLVLGSAAGLQWGRAYRRLHADAIMEMLRCTTEGGLVLVNMSNHVRDGEEQLVVEWWVNELLVRQCSIVEVRRVRTPRQGFGANGGTRVDGEVVIAMRTPDTRRLL
jgi:hypothetical protein